MLKRKPPEDWLSVRQPTLTKAEAPVWVSPGAANGVDLYLFTVGPVDIGISAGAKYDYLTFHGTLNNFTAIRVAQDFGLKLRLLVLSNCFGRQGASGAIPRPDPYAAAYRTLPRWVSDTHVQFTGGLFPLRNFWTPATSSGSTAFISPVRWILR